MSTTTQQTGAEMIAAERQRQMEQEGWTPEHDDMHDAGDLARAAACYTLPAHLRREARWAWGDRGPRPHDWPWGSQWWKPTPQDRVRELVKAGALIAAEIDRLQRATPEGGTDDA
jgi:hypothetical protein